MYDYVELTHYLGRQGSHRARFHYSDSRSGKTCAVGSGEAEATEKVARDIARKNGVPIVMDGQAIPN